MKEQLEKRLVELRAEYESGQKILQDIELKLVELEKRKNDLSDTLLRISGAIDLLEEVLGKSADIPEQETVSSAAVASENVEVPNVVRQLLKKAIETLEEAGLSAGEVVEQKGVFPVGITSGEILRQDPKPGMKIPAGSPVKLVVASKGKFMPPLERRSVCDSFSDSN